MRKISDKIKQQIIEYYTNGLQQLKIASLVGISYITVRRFIKTTSVYKTRRELADIKILNKQNKLKSITSIDIPELIKLYINGNSMHKLCIKYNVGHIKITKILIDNNIQIRNHSESLSTYKRSPLTVEHRKKISESRLKYLHLNPDKVPYRLWNTAGYVSYPHNKIMSILKNMNIQGWISEYQNSIYSYDIAFPELKLDIEIDGSTHSRPETIISDARRDAYSTSQGWKVLRFTASDVVKDSTKVVDSIIDVISSINPTYLSTFDSNKWNIQKQNFINYKAQLHKKSQIHKTVVHKPLPLNIEHNEEHSIFNILYKKCEFCNNDFVSSTVNQLYCNKSCAVKYRHKDKASKRPSVDVLIYKIKSTSYVAVGKEYGVSDNAIRKWVKAYGIDPKTLTSLINKTE